MGITILKYLLSISIFRRLRLLVVSGDIQVTYFLKKSLLFLVFKITDFDSTLKTLLTRLYCLITTDQIRFTMISMFAGPNLSEMGLTILAYRREITLTDKSIRHTFTRLWLFFISFSEPLLLPNHLCVARPGDIL